MKENHSVLTPGLVQEMDAIMTHYQHDTSNYWKSCWTSSVQFRCNTFQRRLPIMLQSR